MKSRFVVLGLPQSQVTGGLQGLRWRQDSGEWIFPVGILVRPDGRQAYVANTNADIITVIDLVDWKIIRRLTAGKEPDGMSWTIYRSKEAEL